MGHLHKSNKQRPSRLLKTCYAAIALTLFTWLVTQQFIIGHIPPDNYCFSIGGGYIEYGYGWDWIRQKMIGLSGMPPQGWFVGRPVDFPGRTFATVCIPFRIVCFTLATPLYFKIWRLWLLRKREGAVDYTDIAWVVFGFAMICTILNKYEPDMILLTLAGAGFCAFIAIAFAIWRNGKRVAWSRAVREFPVCPKCKYAMKGLHSARCPECGTQYTLDELWQSQRDFE